MDNKEEMNEQKDRKTDKKKRQEKKIMFEHEYLRNNPTDKKVVRVYVALLLLPDRLTS